MKYLKKIFEGLSNEDKETIEAICYDLTDDGEFKVRIGDYRARDYRDDQKLYGISVAIHNDISYVCIENSNSSRSNLKNNFKILDVAETVERIEKYLGNRFIISNVRNENDNDWKNIYFKLVDGSIYTFNSLTTGPIYQMYTNEVIVWFVS